MRMAPHQLPVQSLDHFDDREVARLGRHLGVEEHLEQQVAELLLQVLPIPALDRIEHLIRLFKCVFSDRIEALLAIPRAAAWGAQPSHDRDRLGEDPTSSGSGFIARSRRWGGHEFTVTDATPILAKRVTVLLSIFAVLAGLAFGSFLNVCISRLPQHESVVVPRSRCPHCFAQIRSWDNIPILSWILLQGRCRDCGVRIPLRYPLVELATAALFLLCLLAFGPTVHAIAAAVLCWLLLGLAVTDAETMLLPDALTYPGIAFGVVQSAFLGFPGDGPVFDWRHAATSLLWAGCAASVILIIRALYWLVRRREGIGLGDAKLLAMIAAWLGPQQTALVLFLGVVGAAFYGLALVALRGGRRNTNHKIALTSRIPLGSFLCAASIVSVFKGDAILNWYLGYFR